METLLYLAKVGIIYALLYSIYFLFFRNNTNFQANRIYLLSIIPIAFILPAINSSIEVAVQYQITLPTIDIGITNTGSTSGFNWSLWLVYFYTIVSGILLSIFIINLLKTMQTILKIKKGIPLNIQPFSFFSFIHAPENIPEEDRMAIVYHEQIHSNQLHSLDIIVYEISKVLLWWNPFLWMGLQSVKSNHEFIADKLASEKADKYSSVLVAQLLGVNCSVLANNFNYEPLIKKRIMMMKTKKSNRLSMFKYALVLPVVALAFMATAQKNVSSTPTPPTAPTAPSAPSTPVAESIAMAPQVDEDKVYEKVDVMPEFKGGMEGLINYLSSNIKYPDESKKNNTQGMVLVDFVIDAKGNIKDIKIIQSVDELIDKEALRVVSNMPKWKPGEKDGKKVNVQFKLPISFKL